MYIDLVHTYCGYNCLKVSLVNLDLVSGLNHLNHPNECISNLLHDALLTVETITKLLMEHLYNNTLSE